MINKIIWESSILTCGISIISKSSVEFNRYTYSATTSVINPKVMSKIRVVLDLRYAKRETTTRNCEIINETRCNIIWYIICGWKTWGIINGTTDNEITILAINTNSLGLL